MMIDAHVHFWKYDPVRDNWMKGMDILHKDYLPKNFLATLSDTGVDGCVAVQSEQSEGETLFLKQLADNNPIIKAVVGWVDLLKDNIEDRLNYFSQFPVIKGFRHIVQHEPDGFLIQENFKRGIKALGKFNYTYDILVYPHLLNDVLQLIQNFPEHNFIIDHCAKPVIKNKYIDSWAIQIKEIARFPNVYCKLSGLLTEANWNLWKPEDFYPYLDVVFNAFGTNRLLYGSDWPVMLLSGEYIEWTALIKTYMNNFSTAEKDAVFGLNASKFYKL